MMNKNEELVKIVFNFHSNLLDEWTVETMWAQVVDKDKGLYKLENIPFYASVASDDIVFAEIDETEGRLTYRETVEYSGNSTIQVVVLKKDIKTNEIRDSLQALGCISEKYDEGYFVVEIPAEIDYKPIKQKLDELQTVGIIDYAEPCLSYKHSY